VRFAANNALNTHALHQPRDGATGNVETLAAELDTRINPPL
jgi:hypothetical protein